MRRAKHNLSFYRMVTGNLGELMPIGMIPVLPGDTFQHRTTSMIRFSPLNVPVMHPIAVRIHHFFVPSRIVWPEWEEFITGGDGGAPPTIPTIATTTAKKSVLTYLGLPALAGATVSELPVRAFNKIFNEWYRDQDLITERLEDDITIPFIAWGKDYFTTARPWTQKGADVSIPIGGAAEVHTAQASGGADVGVVSDVSGNMSLGSAGATVVTGSTGAITADELLYADLSTATSPNVNDWRRAFALQRYQEARARYGSRFTEYLRYLGVRPSDARLQRPEYLGGGSARANFSEVLQTTQTDAAAGPEGVGDLYGHGIAGVRSNRYRKFFEEHGYVISCMSLRPSALYVNGVQKEWLKTTKEDFFQKELVNLGQQEVNRYELFLGGAFEAIGFQDRYHEYRSQPSQVSQDFRDTLNAYHVGRDLAAGVTLNADFINCEPSDRIFQTSTSVADSLWCMVNHRVGARRLVPARANPRIL